MSKKLILFSYDFPPSNGGIARLCHEIAIGMQLYFEEVIVLTRTVQEKNRINEVKNIRIIELTEQRVKCEINAYNFLRKLKNKHEYQILCGVWHPEASIAYLAGFKNVYILGHGTEFLAGKSTFRKYFWLSIYAKWILGKVKLNIANSAYTKGLIHQINPKAKSVALPLGVDEVFFRPDTYKKTDLNYIRIGTLSRILKFKGYDFIANTIASLPNEIKRKVIWNIGGIGPYLNELKELVKELEIEDNVNFYGYLPENQLPDFYKSNDIFVLCTRASTKSIEVEGFGLVFLEAQSCGVPVIGTNTGGITSAIRHNNGGWLVDQDNIEQLQALLKDCFNDRGIIKKQSLLARKRVIESCTWANYNKSLNKLLQI
jgi:phosphatidylinositol alpha-1,6-mannosyltransferase